MVVEKAAEPTIHAEINGGRRDGEVAGSIQMRFNVREESRKRCQEAEEVAGDVMEEEGGGGPEASTVHAGLYSSVFLFREDSHKVLYTEFYPILSLGSPRSQGGYGM